MNFGTRETANDVNLDGRSLKTGFFITLIGAFYLTAAHQTAWAAGFLCGSALSLFSLFSLIAVIKALFRPGGMPFKSAFLLLGLLIKLPTYCLILSLALASKNVSAGALVAGLSLTPAVITLKTIGQALAALIPAKPQPAAKATVTTRRASRRRALRLARERG